jgi:predicted DCC family thiol-disulfide oxidoreductase YuxK
MMMGATFPPGIDPNDQIIMFDGVCKLCNRWSWFIIRCDKQRRFKLCAVQSEQGQKVLQALGYPLDHFETMLLVQGEQTLEKSNAFLAIVTQLPFPWPLIAAGKIVPRVIRDWCYDRIALNRYKLFGKYDHCMLAAPDHEQRFL